MPVASTDAAGTRIRSTSLIAMGPSSSPSGSGMPNSPIVSCSSGVATVQSSRPSSREIGNSTRRCSARAQLTNGRVLGSCTADR